VTHEEPPLSAECDSAVLFAAYLDYYREKAIEKVLSLPTDDRTTSCVPSGWSPLELLHHLAFMEQRWFVWGYLGEAVAEPFGDEVDDRWVLPTGRGTEEVVRLLRATGERTRGVLHAHPQDSVGAVGGRFSSDPPSLAWICFHVLQEYARHVGHLDVAVELAGGPTGE
jgi:hypothetical protein